MKIKLGRIAVILVVLLIVLSLAGFFLNNPRVYTVSRVLLKVDPNQLPTNPYQGYERQFQDISDFLGSTDTEAVLAQSTHARADSFHFIQVEAVRGTFILRLEYCGSDSNVAWNVASNAAYLVEVQYSTNRFETKIEHIDTEFWQPPAVGSRFVDKLKGLF